MLMPEEVDTIGVMVGDLGPIELDVAVTPEYIEKGVQGDCARCPIALAIIDAARAAGLALAECNPVLVGVPNTVIMRQDLRIFRGRLPRSAARFLLCFDNPQAGPVAPFTFNLRLEAG